VKKPFLQSFGFCNFLIINNHARGMSVANRLQSMEKHDKAELTSTKLPQSHGARFRPTGALFEKSIS
jgi:hypothetical protein